MADIDRRSRRGFLKGVAASSLLGALWSSGGVADAENPTARGMPDRQRTPLDPGAVEAELRRRAQEHLGQPRLVVDYYRVGRKIAYPLPVPSLSLPDVPIPGIASYPWATWLLWTLEERITALGWAAEWFHDAPARQAAAADLAALAQWPEYRQYATPDLSAGHAGRILATAVTRWAWVPEDLRHELREACRRHAESIIPASDKVHAAVRTADDVLSRSAPQGLLHNIGLIGTIGAALTAGAVGHPAADSLNARVLALFGAALELRATGFSEGVAYDGYVLDFLADWLGTLPEGDRRAILDHPNFEHYLEQSYMLAAPGAAEQVAELSDVEPRQMAFHLAAQAKLLRLRPHPVRAWHVARCPLAWLRTDALAALRALDGEPARQPPRSGALDAHYAAVLRSGWEAEDLAVAVACSSSPMGHIQSDNGTLVLGTQGTWLIADPGYQQYAKGDERQFTVGPVAHNAPLINGSAQTQKRPRRIVLEDVSPGLHHVAIDLAACYPASLSLKTLVRHVWLSGNHLVVVADELEASQPVQATYHWHAHPAAAWWLEANWALVSLGRSQLWITCPQTQLAGANLHRLPGSRGQLSLVATLAKAGPVVWWVFVLGARRPAVETSPDGRQLSLLDQIFRVSPAPQ